MLRTRIGVLVVVAVALALPSTAQANGGAYIVFDETYYVPGGPASGEAYVYLSESKSSLLERGPFTLYAIPQGSTWRSGRPVPASATPLGTLAVHDESKGEYELTTSFAVPQLAPGSYTIVMCNPGCTLTGFGEPLTGEFVVAETQREAGLLARTDALSIQVANLEHRLKRSEKLVRELETAVAGSEQDRDAAVTGTADLQGQLDAAERTIDSLVATNAATSDELTRWRIATVILAAVAVGAFAVAMTLSARRRRDEPSIPDTPEQLLEPTARR
jgi:hypothetical protein